MTTLVYWSFVLALIPLVLDLIVRTSVGLGHWIAFHVDPFPAAASSTCINLRWTGENFSRNLTDDPRFKASQEGKRECSRAAR